MNILKEIRNLRDQGKLHRSLLIRVRILLAVSTVIAGVVAYQIMFHAADPLFAGGLFIVGLALGMFLFSRMGPVQWNEEEERVEAARMDKLSYGVLALYIGFEILLRTELNSYLPSMSIALLLATICGTLLGRVAGTLVEIHRVYLMSRAQ